MALLFVTRRYHSQLEAWMNKVVARFADGRIIKGSTRDFIISKDSFHLEVLGAPLSSKPMLLRTRELKALFFVKDFAGKPQYKPRQEFDKSKPVVGRKIRVVFKDGEEMVGTTNGYQPGRPAFFMFPADQDSNTQRCLVVAEATREITLL
jgi:Family of unknown function (DUF6982)